MYCKNCGNLLADGDKFCSGCGTKVAAESNAAGIADVKPAVENNAPAAEAEDKPLFEPFDFAAFGFDFSDLGLGTGSKAEGTKPTPPTETFDWNTGEFPDRNATTKTEDIDFNWSLSPEEVIETKPVAEPAAETFVSNEPKWTDAAPAEEKTTSLEEELFGDIESKADETRKQSEEIDKFFTFHKKNEEFQKILDREYEKVRTGNILAEEMNAAEAVSEEKFTARRPEDPMEELFASEGVIKGYEPKPIETDILDRIDAIEEEKRVREEAARLIEEQSRPAAADEKDGITASKIETEEPAAEPTMETAAEPVEETPEVIDLQVEDVPAEEPVKETPAVSHIDEAVEARDPLFAEEPEQEEVGPETTKQVDKAAILAGIAAATEMVQRDREAQLAAEAAAAAPVVTPEPEAVEDVKIELPDFLGHQDEVQAEEPIVVEEVVEEEPVSMEAAPVAEPVVEETPTEEEAPDLEFDIFEQLEAQEAPVEEIILPEDQTIEDLFAENAAAATVEENDETVTEHTVILTEDSVAEILKTVEEDTTKDDTMVFTAHALGAILAEAEQEDPDAKEVVVSLEKLTDLEEKAAEGAPLGAFADAANAEDEEEEALPGGKGRTFLKVCLVILVILLALEVAGVVIKIAAPTSGAANFIDNQLNKVFQLVGEEETTEYNA